MPLASRTTVDSAGGTLLAGAVHGVSIQGQRWAIQGDPVAGHGDGGHAAATMTSGSTFVRINGTPVCIAGSSASCGHTSSGSGHVSVSS